MSNLSTYFQERTADTELRKSSVVTFERRSSRRRCRRRRKLLRRRRCDVNKEYRKKNIHLKDDIRIRKTKRVEFE